MFKRDRQSEEFPERVPTQMAFVLELLHMLRRGTSGAGFEEPSSLHQWNYGEHLGAGSNLQNREEISVVITEYVPGDRRWCLFLL